MTLLERVHAWEDSRALFLSDQNLRVPLYACSHIARLSFLSRPGSFNDPL